MNTIKYNLIPAAMPNLAGTGKHVAQVQIRGSLGFDEVADRMLALGSTVTRPDILAVFECMAVALENALKEGFRVNFGGIFDLFPSVTGTFPSAAAPFDPAINRVDVRARCGTRVRKSVMAAAAAERVCLPKPAPAPLEFRDLGSASVDARVTPGNIGAVSGARLKFDPAAPDEGVFLVPAAGGDPVRAAQVQRAAPRQAVFLVPGLAPGAAYWLEVRARLNGCRELRVGRLGALLKTPAPASP